MVNNQWLRYFSRDSFEKRVRLPLFSMEKRGIKPHFDKEYCEKTQDGLL